MSIFTDDIDEEPTEDGLPLRTKDGLRDYLRANHDAPTKLSIADYRTLDELALRRFDRSRRRRLSGDVIIATPAVREAINTVRTMITNNDRIVGDMRPGFIISGAGTTGKTTITKTLMRTVYNEFEEVFPDFETKQRTPVVYVEVPTGCTGRLLAAALAEAVGLTVAKEDSQSTLMTRASGKLREGRTELVVVDEIQNLVGNNRGIKESIQTLRQLHSGFLGILVLAGVDLLDSELFTDPAGQQLSGRMSLIELHNFTLGSIAEAKLWEAVVLAFEKDMPLLNHSPGTLAKHSKILHDHTGGSISTLGKIFSSAAKSLIRAREPENETITLELLQSQTLDMSTKFRDQLASVRDAKAKRAIRR